MSYPGEAVVFEDLRSYFSTTEWKQLADGDRIICLNVMKNHLFKLSIGLRSVPPEFMARDDGVPTRKTPLLREPSEGQKPHLSDAHTEPDGETAIPSAKDDTERDVPAGVHSICDLCNQFYSEDECEEREPPAAVAHDSHVAVTESRRVNTLLPPRFETSQLGVTDARPRVFYHELPGGRKEAPERDYSPVKRNDYVDAKEDASSSSQREDKTHRLAFAGKKTLASKRRDVSGKSQPEPQTTTTPRQPVHDVGGQKPIGCEQCDKRFGRLSDLKRHRRLTHGERRYRCTRCVKRFSKMSHLKSHQRVHDGERPFHCQQCDKSFSQNSHLKSHQRVHHTGEKPFRCTECDRSFSQIAGLSKHRLVHTFRCAHSAQCDKSFSQPGGLSRHQRLHTGEKPFSCAQCDKSFGKLGHLKRHLQRVHDRETPFHCEQCDKSFSQVGHLKTHRRVHTGEKPFRCTECDRSFSQIAGLGKHRLVHTGEKRSTKE